MDKSGEELENYLNFVTTKLINERPINFRLLNVFLWEKVKFIFNYEDSIEHIYSNNEECIHLLKDEYGYLFFGYIQNSNNYEEISNFNGNELIIESLKKNKRFNELCKDYSVESYRSIIVSNFKLSSYPTSDFFKLSNTTSYFYLFEPNENSGYTLDLNQDEDILERIEKEILIKIMIKENSKLNGLSGSPIWYCEICSGNNEIGCQYFDPTECPKFT
jgi:hypothetical protein